MALFTERRIAHNPAMIPPTGDRRRASRDAMTAGAAVDARVEETYWRSNYMREPYYERGYNFDDYYPAYRTGWEGRARYQNRRFDEVERDLARDYQRNRGDSRLEWAKNRHAARAAWERLEGPDFTERSQ
jgi:hypothetical protein